VSAAATTTAPRGRSLVGAIVRKELRGFFSSAVALVFLGTFLTVVMFSFFWWGGFFARGVADVRPLFDKLPLLLILLVSALSMRVWSEEQRGGTIEILMTLPVSRVQLVLGKFIAGMLLVTLALLLTLGIPLTVSQMGNLDWGPVWGGYLAALLLAAAYLAIGMCMSAMTDSQIVALIGTMAVCILFYIPGMPVIADLASGGTSDFFRAISTSARFESIARGVLDLRDLAYYAGLVVAFLGLNVLLLARRRWSQGARTRGQRVGTVLAVVLVAANALALSVWLAPVKRARVDLTEFGEYSLSGTTTKLLAGLDQPLLIRGYFSDKQHPKLAPLIPRIKDLLEEYKIRGGANVKVELTDPSRDDAAIREAKEAFGIEARPVAFESRVENSVINLYFHILVQYGDKHEVLSFQDLIDVRPAGDGDVEIGLKNFEYDMTKTIKKVAMGFQSLEAIFAALPSAVQVTTYVTPSTLPENYAEAPAALTKVLDEFKAAGGDKFAVSTVEPTTEAQQQELFQKYGIRPRALDLFGQKTFYFEILVQVGERIARIAPAKEPTEQALRTSITEGIKRAAPGFTKVIGLWSPPQPEPEPPMMQGMQPRQMPPPQQFKALEQVLGDTYEVRPLDLSGGTIADDIDVAIIGGPVGLDAKAAEAIDQYMMKGGAVILLAGRYRLDYKASGRTSLAVEQVATGLEDMLAYWGISIPPQMVLDTQSETLPMQVERDVGGGLKIPEVKKVPYPHFVKVTGGGIAGGNPIGAGVQSVSLFWGSPVKVTAPAASQPGAPARRVDTLLTSTSGAWLDDKTMVTPDGSTTVTRPSGLTAEQQGAQPMAVAISGGFPSYVASTQAAAGSAAGSAEGSGSGSASAPSAIAFSPPDARLVVIGSSAMADDEALQMAGSLGSNSGANNLVFLQNAVDWALADTDLLTIRGQSAAARALTVSESSRTKWELLNYVLALVGLLAIVLVSWLRRRAVRPLALPKESAS
jgi:ABC-2 type transport system permease protein